MSDKYAVSPIAHPVSGSIRPPGSKSITNRALICAALAEGRSRLSGALDSDDTRVMVAALRALGVAVEVGDEGRQLTVHGAGGAIPATEADLFIGNSGTSVRFLTALVALGHGKFRLDGVERMRNRPIGDLIAALAALGANVASERNNDCPPVVVHADGLAGGEARVRGDVSSQFLSALLMAAPAAQSPVSLAIAGELVSKPYVDMTRQVMASFGVAVRVVQSGSGAERFEIAPQTYQACSYSVEPDASAASYFWAAAAITGGRVTVEGLSREALQGDVAFVDCLGQMGCQIEDAADSITVTGAPLRGVTIDMNAISDTAQTLAAVALFADGPTQITGIAHNRHKETDRIGDLAAELTKLGATVEVQPDGLKITPGPLRGAEIETYDDHRMAMSLALVGLRQPDVVIKDPACTSKTYPHFFADLESLCRTDSEGAAQSGTT